MDIIDQVFGATMQPEFDFRTQEQVVTFPGIQFRFARQDVESGKDNICYDANSSRSFVARKIVISKGTPVEASRSLLERENLLQRPQIPLECYQGGVFLTRLKIHHDGHRATEFHFHLTAKNSVNMHRDCHDVVHFESSLKLGDNAQDVISALGSPSKIFYKSEDKMKIHSPHSHRIIPNKKADYFLNYFDLGIDCLIDARQHTFKKLIIHTNFPGHYNFNIYQRCWFQIDLPLEDGLGSDSHFQIDTTTKWQDIVSGLGEGNFTDKPVILKRYGTGNTVNPFGHTNCYGLKDMIFEIMPYCNYIASLTFYRGI